MKFWEAMKLLEEGRKVRLDIWCKEEYIMLDDEKEIVDERGYMFDLYGVHKYSNWEEYKENR